MDRHELETAVFGFLGIAQVAFLLMLRGLWDNGIDLRLWVPAMALPLFALSGGLLYRDLHRRLRLGVGFDGQWLMVGLGAITLLTGLLLAPQLTARQVCLIQLAITAVGLGCGCSVALLLRQLRRRAAEQTAG